MTVSRLFLTVTCLLIVGSSIVVAPVRAQGAPTDPAQIALQPDEGGKSIMIYKEDGGEDQFGVWISRRWIRDRDSEDVSVGPIITHNTVYVAKDVEAAKRLFQREKEQNVKFPEAADFARGPFEWKIQRFGEETASLAACVDCNSINTINLHRRVVFRQGRVVAIMYLFGRERMVPEATMLMFLRRIDERARPPEPTPTPEPEPEPQPEPTPAPTVEEEE